MPKKPKPENAIPEGSGIIDGNKVYTINAFCKELGFRRNSSLHQRLIRAGLPVIAGRYIRGRDFIDVLGRVMEEEQREADGQEGQDGEQWPGEWQGPEEYDGEGIGDPWAEETGGEGSGMFGVN